MEISPPLSRRTGIIELPISKIVAWSTIAIMEQHTEERPTEFDGHHGTGVVTDESGTAYPFHCTAIVDGSREIDPGTRVRFEIAVGLGRWEAAALQRA